MVLSVIDDWQVTFKSRNKNDVSYFRPILKLSTLSKLFECTIKDKMFFAVKSLICPNQHGLMPGASYFSILAAFSEDCILSFQKGFQVDIAFTDFSKAFDTVSHSILVM